MVYALPGATFEAGLVGAPTGLEGTIGVQIIDTPSGDVITPRTTAGITETPAGSGYYTVTLTAPDDEGTYSVFWDTGTVTPETTSAEELVVTALAQAPVGQPAAGPGYVSATVVYGRDAGRTYTATSKPSTDQVVTFITDTAAELDAIMRGVGYALPVSPTATSALRVLEHFNALGAAAMIEQAAPTNGGKRDTALQLWADAKKMLASGQVALDDPHDEDTGEPRYFVSATSTFNACFSA